MHQTNSYKEFVFCYTTSSMINTMIYIFLLLIAWYHIIGTGVIFGLNLQHYNTSITLIRDLLRLGIVCLSCIQHRNKVIPRIQKNKYILGVVIATIVLSILISVYMDKSVFSMFVGFKYDFMFTLIFLSASLVWFTNTKPEIDRYIKLYIGIIIAWYLRQAARLWLPDIMYRIWYGPVGDFVFGTNPPIYYRTWPGWDPRLQGIFSWPNNYGYFLIAIAPILYTRLQNKTKTIKASIRSSLRVGIVLTLSRWALIGGITGLLGTYRYKIQQHKKRAAIWASVIIITLLGLSIMKRWSTVEHIQNKVSGIQTVINQPLWYGLWSAGPAIHHEGKRLPDTDHDRHRKPRFYAMVCVYIPSYETKQRTERHIHHKLPHGTI